MTREEAKEILTHNWTRVDNPNYSESELDEAFFMAIEALQAEPIERISDNTIVVKYADYEDIGRIILTNGDIFCKMFYEDARQNDDSDYDSLVPDEYEMPGYDDIMDRLDNLKLEFTIHGKERVKRMVGDDK